MKIKKILTVISVVLSGTAFPQGEYIPNMYNGILANLYLNHQPYAKGEALGRGLVANYEGSFGSYYNPALTSLNKGFNTDISYTESDKTKPSMTYLGVSYSNEKLGSIGVSGFYYSKPDIKRRPRISEYNITSYYDVLYTVNYSREVFKDFYAGVNLGVYHYSGYTYFDMEYPEYFFLRDGITLDLGLLKRFNFNVLNTKHLVQIGAAAYNVTDSKIDFEYDAKESLPVIVRAGASHRLILPQSSLNNSTDFLSVFSHFEYEKVINSYLNEVFKIGEEVTIKDLFSLRLGYFRSKINNGYSYSFPGFTYTVDDDIQEEFTFGLGVKLPLDKWLKLNNGCSLKIDYSSNGYQKYERFEKYTYTYSALGVSLNYIP